jgi:hypothetical protein
VRPDRSFTFDLRTPVTSWMLLQAAGVERKKNTPKGAKNPGHETIGTVSLKHVYEIAKIKKSVRRSPPAVCPRPLGGSKALRIVAGTPPVRNSAGIPGQEHIRPGEHRGYRGKAMSGAVTLGNACIIYALF